MNGRTSSSDLIHMSCLAVSRQAAGAVADKNEKGRLGVCELRLSSRFGSWAGAYRTVTRLVSFSRHKEEAGRVAFC